MPVVPNCRSFFLLNAAANHRLLVSILSRERGRRPSSLMSGQDAMDANCAQTNRAGCVRLSRVVLTPGLLASSSREANASRGRWWQEAPIHQGEHDIGRRAIAQGRPECFRFTCMLMCAFLLMHIAHETAGAARTRSSLRPLLEGDSDHATTWAIRVTGSPSRVLRSPDERSNIRGWQCMRFPDVASLIRATGLEISSCPEQVRP